MELKKLTLRLEAISQEITDKIRECRPSELSKIRELQQQREAVEFSKWLVSIHSHQRLVVLRNQYNTQTRLIPQPPARQSEIF